MEINFFSKKNTFLKQRNRGQAMIVSVIYFLFISLSVVFGVISPSVREYKIASTDLNSKKAYYLGESGVEDVIYRLKDNKNVFESGEDNAIKILTLDGVSAETKISREIGSDEIIINSIGSVSKGHTSKYERRVKAVITSSGSNIDFRDVGILGIKFMGNNGSISTPKSDRSLYSFGKIYTEGAVNANFTIKPSTSSSGVNEYLLKNYISDKDFQELDFGGTEKVQIAQMILNEGFDFISKISFELKIKEENFNEDSCNSLGIKIVEDKDGLPEGTLIDSESIQININEYKDWKKINIHFDKFLTTKFWVIFEQTNKEGKDCLSIKSMDNKYVGDLMFKREGESSFEPLQNQDISFDLSIYEKKRISPFIEDEQLTDQDSNIADSLIENTRNASLSVGEDIKEGFSAIATTINNIISNIINCRDGKDNTKSGGAGVIRCSNPAPDFANNWYKTFPYTVSIIDNFKNQAEIGGNSSEYTIDLSSQDVFLSSKVFLGNLTIQGPKTGSYILTVEGPVWVLGSLTIKGNVEIKKSETTNKDVVFISEDSINIEGGAIFKDSSLIISLDTLNGEENPNIKRISVDGGVQNLSIFAPFIFANLKNTTVNNVFALGLIMNNSTISFNNDFGTSLLNFNPDSYNISSWKEE